MHWILIAGVVLAAFFIPAIVHIVSSSKVRKDNELWMMYQDANDIYLRLRRIFRKSTSPRAWTVAVLFAALENSCRDNGIRRERIEEVAPFVLDPTIRGRSERCRMVKAYVSGQCSAEFLSAVLSLCKLLDKRHGSAKEIASVTSQPLALP